MGKMIDSTLTSTVDGVTERKLDAIQSDESHGRYVPIGFARANNELPTAK